MTGLPPDMRDIWRRFTTQAEQERDDATLKPHLKEAWLRCRRQQLCDRWPALLYAKGVTYQSLCRSNAELLSLAAPIMEDIGEYLEDTPFALLLTDESGCTLSFYARGALADPLATLGIRAGVYWREAVMGNTAITSCLYLHKPLSVTGYEHFNNALHPYAGYAAPLFNTDSDIIGTLALLLPQERASETALALIQATAQQISARLHADLLLGESNQHLSEVHTLLEGVEEGVLAWDSAGIIHYLNQNGCNLLKLKAEKTLGQDIKTLLKLPQRVTAAIGQQREVELFETSVECQNELISLAMSLKIVNPHRYIALLYPIDRLRRLAHWQGGALAHLTFADIDYVGNSPAIRRTIRLSRQAAKGRGSILLHGEEGLGKAYLAQAIHNDSSRCDQPFVTLNCQAIPRESMGMAFLGSPYDTDKPWPSKFELAKGGTLLLENVECLTTEVQAALLHLLKTGLLNRLNQPIVPVDVRVITTTSVDLNRYVEENRFKRHLLYELQSFDIPIPPLRERVEDIPDLVRRYLRVLSGELGHNLSVAPEALQALERYRWPGNHRELRNVLERAMSCCQHRVIRREDLPAALLAESDGPPARGAEIAPLREQERDAIIHAAQRCQGRPGRISAELQISRTSLWRKLKQFNIDLRDYKNEKTAG